MWIYFDIEDCPWQLRTFLIH